MSYNTVFCELGYEELPGYHSANQDVSNYSSDTHADVEYGHEPQYEWGFHPLRADTNT